MNQFDKVISRFNSDSVRWDKYNKDIIPLWVADMDFETPQCVIDAVAKRLNHKIFGYTHAPHQLKEEITHYIKDQFDWAIEPEWIVFTPSLVSSLYSIAQQVTQADDHVLTLQPVYHHILQAASFSNRDYSAVPLDNYNNRLILSADGLKHYQKNNTRLLFFCNPHNPGGSVYSRTELTDIAEFCVNNNIVICSDEIHCNMIHDGIQHIPIASLSEEIADQSITLMSLNKVFNIPGLGLAWMICKNKEIRKKIQAQIGTLIPDPQIISYVSTQAALRHGETWRQELIQYLESNKLMLKNNIKQMQPLQMYTMEASYLTWIDCSQLKIEDPAQLFLEHGLALQPGSMFQQDNHVRINIATPKSVLSEALNRMHASIDSLQA
ncbi:aminotransferase [beta proteobacterium KB13]|uniref:cysteine-S-conjugate beta-lyase n=1 Tax=beta proteobacterium KB13 TaxID=314607 RepID=B6BU10_9PROT|nr:aminotransferase [beta proteobacterium KB13]